MPRASIRARRAFGLTGVGAALLIIGSLIVGPQLRSPAQVAAEAAAPPRSRITVPVEQRALTEPVVLRGRVEQGSSIKIMPSPGATGDSSVITAVRIKIGQRIREGQVAFERSGEPMVCLVLAFPLYRDITAGMSGPDVRELQRALRRLGFRTPVSGTFDASTTSSLARFYTSLGYATVTADPEADRRKAEAREQRARAEADLAEAQRTGVGETKAQAALASSLDALKATESASGPSLKRSWVLRLDKSGRKVSKVGVKVGAVLTDSNRPLLELDSERPYVSARAGRDQAALLKVGQSATVLDEENGKRLSAKVSSIGGVASSGAAPDAEAEEGVPVRFVLTGEFAASSTDQSLRIELTADAGAGKVLAVPVTAVYSNPDGTTHVTLEQSSGSLIEVPVSTGKIAGGWVQVTPAAGASLFEGQQVIVDDTVATSTSGQP